MTLFLCLFGLSGLFYGAAVYTGVWLRYNADKAFDRELQAYIQYCWLRCRRR